MHKPPPHAGIALDGQAKFGCRQQCKATQAHGDPWDACEGEIIWHYSSEAVWEWIENFNFITMHACLTVPP
jgi:hypothetical protein